MFKDKTILITGGTGSWGVEAVKQLLERNPKQIIIYSRNECNQVTMARNLANPKLKFIIGDIRDYEQVDFACQGVDYILHLAALKHVPICEEFPYESIKTNILGTENIIKAAIKNKVKRVIDVSSDKSCDAAGVYGATKFIAERMILHANTYNSNTEFQCIRGGNVLGSAGSVVPLFISQIKKNNKITITDERMTRYFITLQEAIKLIFTAIESNIIAATYIMNMPSCKITDLADVLIAHYGDKETQVEITGMRPGEKLHEVLISKTEALNSYIYSDEYFVIFPFDANREDLQRVKFEEYNSSTKFMQKKEIKALLQKGGFLH
jgi:FlaA1/EpsC-like NDP-sugar epimerase